MRRFSPEWEQARGTGLQRIDFASLHPQDVPGQLIAQASAAVLDVLLRNAVSFQTSRHFDFARYLHTSEEERVLAYTLLARDEDGAPLDVIAWHPRTKCVATWLGRTGLMGPRLPRSGDPRGSARRLSDPLAWMADACCSVIVHDDRLARPCSRLEPFASGTSRTVTVSRHS